MSFTVQKHIANVRSEVNYFLTQYHKNHQTLPKFEEIANHIINLGWELTDSDLFENWLKIHFPTQIDYRIN